MSCGGILDSFFHYTSKVCVQLPTYAANMALPAFARCCCRQPAAMRQLAAAGLLLCCGSMAVGQRDGHRTVTYSALYTMWAVPITLAPVLLLFCCHFFVNTLLNLSVTERTVLSSCLSYIWHICRLHS